MTDRRSVVDVPGPVPFIDAGALVHGRAAAVLADVLLELVEQGRFSHLPEEHRLLVLRSVRAVVMAGDRWHFRMGSDVGSSETPRAPVQGRSGDEVLSIAEAARMLNVSDRRVRQIAPQLGDRVGGTWVLDRDLVEAEAERRAAS